VFSDTQAFALTGKPITGATYIRQKYGPVPKAIMPVRSELHREGAIRVFREGKVERTTATSAPDMRSFASSEMAIIDWWIEHISSYHTAATISDKSHGYTWQIAEMGEEIPMVATFATRIREPQTKRSGARTLPRSLAFPRRAGRSRGAVRTEDRGLGLPTMAARR
jgi:hypothetical protein